MNCSIQRAAECIQSGNHRGAEDIIATLQSTSNLDEVIAVMKTETSSRESTYVHFVSLKLLKIFLVRQREVWLHNVASVLQFLVDYSHALDAKMLSHEWRPAVVELASCIAVVLKLGCIGLDAQVNDGEVVNVVRCLVDGFLFLGANATAARLFFLYMVTQRTIEEFGLFDVTSRQRGLPVSCHRRARTAFEGEDHLAQLALSLLHRAVQTPGATVDPQQMPALVDAALGGVVACLTWPSHRFFEEDSATDESCALFTVVGPYWDRLFFSPFGPDTASLCGPTSGETLFSVLATWYVSHSANGVPVTRQRVAEISQLLCSFKGSAWEPLETARFVTESFALCMSIFESIAVGSDAVDFHLLPVLANSLLLLISNFTECILCDEMNQLLSKFSDMTLYLIVWDSKEDDDNVMSSLDEALSAWLQLALFVDRDRSTVASATGGSCSSSPSVGRDVFRRSCCAIFGKYLESKTAACAVDEDEDGIADAFTNSHLELVAYIGRVSPCDGGTTLTAALQSAVGQVSAATSHPLDEAAAVRVNEAVWILVKVAAFFIADKADGEEPCVPRCFQEPGSAAALVHLVETLMSASAVLFAPNSCVTSPAVYTAYADALTAYCRSYVEPEESVWDLFSHAIGGGAGFVTFALQFALAALQNVPYEKDCMYAVCALLDGIADKSAEVRAFVVSQGSFTSLVHLSTCESGRQFVGHTRGRLLGFVVSCAGVPPPSTGGLATAQDAGTEGSSASLGSLLKSASRQSSSVNELLDCLTTIAGLFESVRRQDVVRALFSPVMATAENLLRRSLAQFNERELAIEVVQCVHSMFSACVLVLENKDILTLLALVQTTEEGVSTVLRSTSTWQGSADAESDRVLFLTWTGKLVAAVAQWKLLDCFLPDEDVSAIMATTSGTLATLLDCLDQRTLCYPELEETLFSSLEMCTEAMPTLIVFSPQHSNTFFSATFYALTSDHASTQRAGVSVASHAADCLGAASGTEPNGGTAGVESLLRVLLRSLASGKVQPRNVRLVAKTLLKLSRHSGSPEALQTTCAATAAELPGSSSFLERVFADVTNHLAALGGTPVSAAAAGPVVQQFEDKLQDHLSVMRGTSLI